MLRTKLFCEDIYVPESTFLLWMLHALLASVFKAYLLCQREIKLNASGFDATYRYLHTYRNLQRTNSLLHKDAGAFPFVLNKGIILAQFETGLQKLLPEEMMK